MADKSRGGRSNGSSSPRYSDRYGAGRPNPYMGGQPKRDQLLRELEERREAERLRAQAEAERREDGLPRGEDSTAEAAPVPAGTRKNAAHAVAQRRRRVYTEPRALRDEGMRERLRQIQRAAAAEAASLGEAFEDDDMPPDVKLRLSDDEKPLIALESRDSDGRLHVRWVPVVLSDEDMAAFFPTLEGKGVTLQDEYNNRNMVAGSDDTSPPVDDELVLIPIAGLEEPDAAADDPVLIPIEGQSADGDDAPGFAVLELLDGQPASCEEPETPPQREETPEITYDEPDETDVGFITAETPPEPEISEEEPVPEEPNETGNVPEEEIYSPDVAEDLPRTDDGPEEAGDVDGAAENVSGETGDSVVEADSSDEDGYAPCEADVIPDEADDVRCEELEDDVKVAAGRGFEAETENRRVVSARPIYDELNVSTRYVQPKYTESEQEQDESLFIRKERPGSTALFVLPDGVKMPKYIDDDAFVEQWLDEGEADDMAIQDKKKRRRVSTVIGALTMVFAIIGLIAIARWGIGMLGGIGSTDSQKTEYAGFISPVVMSEVPVFETWDAIPQDKLLQSAVFSVLLNMDETVYAEDDTSKLIIPSEDMVNAVKTLYGASDPDAAVDEEINTRIRNALFTSAGENITNADVYYVDLEDSFHVVNGVGGPVPNVTDISRRDEQITLTVDYLEDLEGGNGEALYTRQFILTKTDDGYFIKAVRQFES